MSRVAEGDVAALLVVLGQSHAVASAALGPHSLSWSSVFDLQGSTPRAELPPVDGPVVDDQHIEDEGTLRWASTEDSPGWALSQANNHERGRDVIALGERMFVRMRHRGWVAQPYDDAAVALWLDDAQQTVHDAVEFAAPRLAVEKQVVAGQGIAGGEAWVLTLSLAPADVALDAERPSAKSVRRTWRENTKLTKVSGKVTVDGTTGIWLAADLNVQYGLVGADRRKMVGSLSLKAEVKVGPPEPIRAPSDLVELPTRRRYVDERQALLEGL